ncbi:hypothetical protein [Brevundimonas naejangsanensis]
MANDRFCRVLGMGLNMQTTWPLAHVIAATEVDAEEMKLREVLAGAGYDVAKLTLTPLAQQVVAEEVKAVVRDRAVPLVSAMHEGLWIGVEKGPR